MKSLLLHLLALSIYSVQGELVHKIEHCGTHCSQGLRCKAKPFLSFEHCKSLPHDVNRHVFSNTNISTVMMCKEQQQCSLHLRVSTHVRITEYIHGIYVCVVSAGMMEDCWIMHFPRTERKKLVGKQVNIKNDCLEVNTGQDVHVTLQTWPQFCDVAVSKSTQVPDCRNKDLQKNVPECIMGKIDYKLDLENKEMHVSVSDMQKDKDYQVRLCHKDYICTGIGAHALLKKENPVKNVTLKYSKLLPCLCIEGWSIMTDAPRVQVCPFKNHFKELWSGITFDLVEETLSWESACSIKAVVTLCELQNQGTCKDFANSSHTYVKGKVTFSSVDPHPRLCMKFTVDNTDWVKCPFSKGNFPAWNLDISTADGHPQLIVTSGFKTSLSLIVCAKTNTSECNDTQRVIINVEDSKPVQPNLTVNICGSNNCIKAQRADVKYGITTLYCQPPCSDASSMSGVSDHEWQLTHIVVPAVTLTTAVVVLAVVTTVAMIGFNVMKTTKTKKRTCLPGPHRALFSPMAEELDSKTQLTSLLNDGYKSESPHIPHSEKSSLLSDLTHMIEV